MRSPGTMPLVPEDAPTPLAAVAAGVDQRVRVRRLALRGLGMSGALFLLFLPLAVGVLASHVVFLAGALLAGLLGLISFLSLVIAGAAPPPRLLPQRIAVEGGAVRLAGVSRGVFPFARVAQGWWEDPDRVHLAMKGGTVLVVKVTSAAEGDRLLRAAGVTAAERVLRVPLVSAASQIPGGSVFGGLVLAVFGSMLFTALVTLAYGARDMMASLASGAVGAFSLFVIAASLLSFTVFALASALRRREVVVGTDAIAYRRTLRTELIPYGSLAAVELDTRGVRLVRKDGRKLLLPTRRVLDRPLPLAAQSSPARTPAEAQRRVLVERIQAAMAAGGSASLSQVNKDRLDRNRRSREAWLGNLGRLLGAGGDYREAGISPEDLGALIEDAAAPVERRVAAAVALSAREQAEARRRVRVAVQASADDDLRLALEAAAEGEIAEAHLGRAMARRV